MNSARTAPRARLSIDQLVFHATAVLLLATALVFSARMFPDNFFIFHAQWLLHPFEQEHLSIARNIAETGELTIPGEPNSRYFGSEDGAFIGGRYVPRGVIGPYLILAGAFLISDSAWMWVTPICGLLAMIGMAFLVRRLAASWLAGIAAAILLGTASPFLINATGRPVDNVMALAALMWACVFLETHLAKPTLATGLAAGLSLGAIPLLRIDYAPISIVALLALVASAGSWAARRSGLSRRDLAETLPIVLILTGCAMVLALNWLLYGDPLKSGYGANAWQGSAEGVANNLAAFSLDDFLRLVFSYLIQIGLPSSVLLALGLALTGLMGRRPSASEIVLLGLSAFLLYFHLGKAGANGNGAALLDLSPPRYLLPVYATGIVVGVTSIFRTLSSTRRLGLARIALLVFTILGATVGIREAYTNPGGIPKISDHIARLRTVHEFASQHTTALFVGDLNTKAIITTERILIPRLMRDPSTLPGIIRSEMDKGHATFIVDDEGQLAGSPLNSGYVESLRQAGFYVCPAAEGVWTFQEVVDVSKSHEVARLLLDSRSGSGSQTPPLAAGKTYYFLAQGSFQYKNAGNKTDAQQLSINGARPFAKQNPDSRYCAVLVGNGKPVTTSIVDSVYGDNQGTITLTIVTRGAVNGD